jgi:hypothetical protein
MFSGGIPLHAAGGILVRSGEHKDFSRLVFDLKPSIDWKLTKTKTGYELSFNPQPVRLNISRIFQFIPKTRLVSATLKVGKPGTLLLNVAQNYHVEIVRTPTGKLVVDIKPGADVIRFIPPNLADILGQNSSNLQSPRPKYPSGKYPPEPPALAAFKLNTTSEPVTIRPAGPPFSSLPNIRVLQAQKELVSQLGRAMTQGIIDADKSNFYGNIFSFKHTDQHQLSSQNAPLRTNVATFPAGEALVKPATQDIRSQLNLSANTVYDREWGLRSTPVTPKIADVVCINDRDLELANWADDKPVDSEVAKLRLGLTGEFDRTNISTLTSLVKLYIARGFGTEAKALMRTFGVKLNNEDLYYDMADIIETGGVVQSRVLAGQSVCPGASAMWAILARPKIPVGEVPDARILNKYFAKLPARLRRRIGPFLGETLLNAGFVGEAQQIAKLIARAPGKPNPQTTLFVAKLNLAEQKPKKAQKELLALIEHNQVNSPEALLMLMNILLHSPKPIPQYLITETAARAFELRYSSQGKALLKVEILAWAHDQSQAEAFAILNHSISLTTLDALDVSAVTSEIFLSFDLKSLNARDFVSMFFQHRNLLAKVTISGDARLHIAKGLLQSGLPDVALSTVAPLMAHLTPKGRRLVAEIYLATDNPQAAIRILSPDHSQIADGLRIAAFSKTGAYDKALKIASTENLLGSKGELAWKAGQWAVAAQNGMPSRQRAAKYYLQATQDGQARAFSSFQERVHGPKKRSLAQLKSLVINSQKARAEVETLLNDNPFP